MRWKGDGTGAVHVAERGVHAATRAPAKPGVQFEFKKVTIERKRVTKGSAQTVSNSLLWDSRKGRLRDTPVPPPSTSAVTNLMKSARRHLISAMPPTLTTATVSEYLESLVPKKDPVAYQALDEFKPLVLANRIEDLGFVFTCRKARYSYTCVHMYVRRWPLTRSHWHLRFCSQTYMFMHP
eukprot:GHVU01082035.1.p1 GENE.GHVU01082035.1~~GHVU01082035.1.p1  ORF type:complete len:181 (+),score=14.52 GHVU01082035.1:158-700(+)